LGMRQETQQRHDPIAVIQSITLIRPKRNINGLTRHCSLSSFLFNKRP
jgi:hypothetical protein